MEFQDETLFVGWEYSSDDVLQAMVKLRRGTAGLFSPTKAKSLTVGKMPCKTRKTLLSQDHHAVGPVDKSVHLWGSWSETGSGPRKHSSRFRSAELRADVQSWAHWLAHWSIL